MSNDAKTSKPAPMPAKPAAAGAKPSAASVVDRAGAASGLKPNSRIDWKTVWPLPALLVATGLLVGGLALAVIRAPKADPAEPLRQAASLIAEAKYEEAIDVLNERIVPAIQKGMIGKDRTIEFHLLRARALSEGQKKLGINRPENHKAVVTDYDEAVKHGWKLEAGDQFNQADALVALGQTPRALEIADKLPEKEDALRLKLWMKVVEANLKAKDVNSEVTLGVLQKMLDRPQLSAEDKAWAIARQTEVRLAMDFNEEAIEAVLRVWQRMDGVSKGQRGELLALLGRGYFQLAEQKGDVSLYTEAAAQLNRAMDDLDPADNRRAEAQLLLARILKARGKIDEAKDAYGKIRSEHQTSPAAVPALLGQAECHAALGEDDEAVALYDEVNKTLVNTEQRRDLDRGTITRSLLDRAADRFQREDYAHALQYARLAEKTAKGIEPRPVELSPMLAASHRKLAEQALAQARGGEAANRGEVSPVAQSEAKRHFYEAGLAYREHAREVVVSDNKAYLDALFMAGDSFDQAADRGSAKDAFSAYVEGAGDTDQRRMEAKFRLAQIFQAEQNYTGAEDLYRQLAGLKLVEENGKPLLVPDESIKSAGEWGDRAITPLAHCILSDRDPANDDLAVRLLQDVVDGRRSDPRSISYRDAITELGELNYLRGDYTRAIEQLERAGKYEDHPRALTVKYKLADACRLSVGAIAADLAQSMPVSDRQRLEVLREDRLRSAAGRFQQVIDELESKQTALQASQRVMLRNSMFYLGDCAFDLGRDYEQAIALYDQAAQKYSKDPGSLVARTQIVAAWVAMGKWEEARRANELAKSALKDMPEASLRDPDLPMQRRHWQAWFDADSMLQKRAEAARSANAEPGAATP